AKARRSLGIGVTNFAYCLAKKGAKYSGVDGNKLVHETFVAVQFYLLKASYLLASDKGACEWFGQKKYAKGLLPID
ncbi:ribonucleotide-diphosphate reductase subunit alpha, partial [Klebsiella pneumoniae]|nr:ribonucleotide-diphosphate reductase subunit alpha [Klebsiella pneumoniae]